MSRQDYLMSQIDLDPIESNYSAEQKQMSTNLNTHNKVVTSMRNKDLSPEKIDSGVRRETHGEQTMVDGSFNSLSHGRSINNSSGGAGGLLNMQPVPCGSDEKEK